MVLKFKDKSITLISKESNNGRIIIKCNVCKSLYYPKIELIINMEYKCPYCRIKYKGDN